MGAEGSREILPSISPIPGRRKLPPVVAQCRFEILAAMKDAFDQNQIRLDHERDRSATLETRRAKARQDVVAPRAAPRKQGKPLALSDETADIGVRCPFTGVLAQVVVQFLELVGGARREDDAQDQGFARRRPRRCCR